MSDMDRAPLIRVQVDQEVFVDSVREGDRLEDATVATEVTSFDRVGDAYVLEGAIVFAGYAKRSQDKNSSETSHLAGSSLDFSDGVVQHVHHRMPFFLRVPVKSQPRGLVNVASRIARWNLEVIESGWVHVTADLNIVGLNGEQGYHFQCGAQEDGDVLFDSTPQSSTSEVMDSSYVKGSPVDEEEFASMMRSAEAESEADTDKDSEHVSAVRSSDEDAQTEILKTTEELSEARGGQVVEDLHPEERGESSVPQPSASDFSSGPTAAQQLADFDRVFGGADNSPRSTKDGQSSSEDSPRRERGHTNQPEADWAEFEFEHQLNLADEKPSTADPLGSQEQFVPSRSFSSEGFHAASGFVASQVPSDLASPEEKGANLDAPRAEVMDSSGEVVTRTDSENEAEVEDGNRGETVHPDSLWSFVDFNAPERAHTLRFVVVQEEETLELIAERIGCTRADLIRVNQLQQETVVAGQMLMAPSHSSMVVH